MCYIGNREKIQILGVEIVKLDKLLLNLSMSIAIT